MHNSTHHLHLILYARFFGLVLLFFYFFCLLVAVAKCLSQTYEQFSKIRTKKKILGSLAS